MKKFISVLVTISIFLSMNITAFANDDTGSIGIDVMNLIKTNIMTSGIPLITGKIAGGVSGNFSVTYKRRNPGDLMNGPEISKVEGGYLYSLDVPVSDDYYASVGISSNVAPALGLSDGWLYEGMDPNIVEITKPLIDRSLATAEMGYRMYYNMAVSSAFKTSIMDKSIPKSMAKAIAADNSIGIIVEILTSMTMRYWKYSVMGNMRNYVLNLFDPDNKNYYIDGTSYYTLAMSNLHISFGRAHELFERSEKMLDEAKAQLYETSMKLKAKRLEREKEYQKVYFNSVQQALNLLDTEYSKTKTISEYQLERAENALSSLSDQYYADEKLELLNRINFYKENLDEARNTKIKIEAEKEKKLQDRYYKTALSYIRIIEKRYNAKNKVDAYLISQAEKSISRIDEKYYGKEKVELQNKIEYFKALS